MTAVGPVRRPRPGSPAHRALYGWQSRAECRGEDTEMFFSLRCRCGELDVEHAIRANGTRGACSVSRGPKATPCGCRQFVEVAAS